MKAWLVRIAAIILFAWSFFLPAVLSGGPAPDGRTFPGYLCAGFASVIAFTAFAHTSLKELNRDAIVLPMSGLVNYLFLVVLVLSFWRKLVRTRLILGVLLLACFGATWTFFAANQISPLLGHYLWVAGALLFVVPDLFLFFSRRAPIAATVSNAGDEPVANSAGDAAVSGR